MPREFSRSKRVGARLQRELAQLIQFEIRDPKMGLITVSAVEMSRNVHDAKVFVTVINAEYEPQEVLKILNETAPYLRHLLGKQLVIRALPNLRFIYDVSVERGASLSALIDSAIDSNHNH